LRQQGKASVIYRLVQNSTADMEQIRKWWTKTPNANIGIPTGEKSDWLVLDVDDGGDETISALEATYGKLPDTLLLLQEVEVGTMSLNTLKAGVSK